MARKRTPHTKSNIERKRPRNLLKPILALWMIFLVALAAILTLRIGETRWSIWLIEHRMQLIGFLVLAIIISGISIPIIAEVEKDPRPLSGSDADGKWLI
jgi:hypothetical protein